jgi:hypothetical protein
MEAADAVTRFLSYSRAESAATVQALNAKLGEAAFLDTTAFDDGEPFPERLLDAILDAVVVVIFATGSYAASHFCRLEMRLALAGGDAQSPHLVLALGDGCDAVLEAIPAAVAGRSWPEAGEPERLEARVRQVARPPPREPVSTSLRRGHSTDVPRAKRSPGVKNRISASLGHLALEMHDLASAQTTGSALVEVAE